jgi:hypothetical protein
MQILAEFPQFKAIISLMMEAVSTSETPVNSTRLHCATSQKAVVLACLFSSNK